MTSPLAVLGHRAVLAGANPNTPIAFEEQARGQRSGQDGEVGTRGDRVQERVRAGDSAPLEDGAHGVADAGIVGLVVVLDRGHPYGRAGGDDGFGDRVGLGNPGDAERSARPRVVLPPNWLFSMAL